MAEKDRFSVDEWDALVKAPTAAFSLVFAADKLAFVSMVKESFAGGQAIRAARKEDDWPDVVAEMIDYQESHRRELSAGTKSGETMAQARRIGRDLLAEAAQAAEKLAPEEMEAYLRWVLGIARHVAESAKELGSDTRISPKEAAALEEIERVLRGGSPSEDEPDEAGDGPAPS